MLLKKFAVCLAVPALALSLSACSDDKDSKGDSPFGGDSGGASQSKESPSGKTGASPIVRNPTSGPSLPTYRPSFSTSRPSFPTYRPSLPSLPSLPSVPSLPSNGPSLSNNGAPVAKETFVQGASKIFKRSYPSAPDSMITRLSECIYDEVNGKVRNSVLETMSRGMDTPGTAQERQIFMQAGTTCGQKLKQGLR